MEIDEHLTDRIVANSFYWKSIDTWDSFLPMDSSIFDQIDRQLIDLVNEKKNIVRLFLFLLEHLPLEIDVQRLKSTDIDQSAATRKISRPEVIPSKFVQYATQSEKILKKIFLLLQKKNLQECLCLEEENRSLYLHCFEALQPFSLQTNYDKHPLAVQLVVHLIKSLDRATLLGDYFDWIFPISLMTLDDPTIDVKLVGLDVIDHVQRYATSTELSLFNRSNVILFGLEQNLHRRGDRILFYECLLATTFRWLAIVENEIYSGKHLFHRTSQLLNTFLRDCLLEVNIDYRRILLKILSPFVRRLELFSLRHLKELIELIDDAIESHILREDALELLLVIINVVRPRIDFHRYELMKILIRCSMKMIHEEKREKKIFDLLQRSFLELQRTTSENYVRNSLQSLIETTHLDRSYRDYCRTLMNKLVDED